MTLPYLDSIFLHACYVNIKDSFRWPTSHAECDANAWWPHKCCFHLHVSMIPGAVPNFWMTRIKLSFILILYPGFEYCLGFTPPAFPWGNLVLSLKIWVSLRIWCQILWCPRRTSWNFRLAWLENSLDQVFPPAINDAWIWRLWYTSSILRAVKALRTLWIHKEKTKLWVLMACWCILRLIGQHPI